MKSSLVGEAVSGETEGLAVFGPAVGDAVGHLYRLGFFVVRGDIVGLPVGSRVGMCALVGSPVEIAVG